MRTEQNSNSAAVANSIFSALSETPFACTSLTPLSGGITNHVFRGQLRNPLPDGTTEVAVKHGASSPPGYPGLELPIERSDIEAKMLSSLPPSFSPTITSPSPFQILTPKLHHFSPTNRIQVQSYLPTAISLKHFAFKHFLPAPNFSPFSAHLDDALLARKNLAHELGRALGSWLRAFHAWANRPEEEEAVKLKEMVGRLSGKMARLVLETTYGSLGQVVGEFRDIFEGDEVQEVLNEVRAFAEREMEQAEKVVHGDFWTGNILLPDQPIASNLSTPVFLVDWESVRLGNPATDLGQMLAEMYELTLFEDIPEGRWLAEGLVSGYGFSQVDEGFIYRAALHCGVHFVVWGSRAAAGWESTKEKVSRVVREGKNLIWAAWRRERERVESGEWGFLFDGRIDK